MGRIAKWLGITVLVVVVAAVALTVTAIGVLNTSWGSDKARRAMLSQVNDGIAGRLDMDRLRLRGRTLKLAGITLRDPDGKLVASVSRVETTVAPMRLLNKTVGVRALDIFEPRVYLKQDERGSNLSRALAPKGKPPEASAQAAKEKAPEPEPGSGWKIELDRFGLSGGLVDVVLAAARPEKPGAEAAPDQHFRLAGLQMAARGSYDTGDGSFKGDTTVRGESRRMPEGKLLIEARGSGDRQRTHAHAEVSLGSVLALTADADTPGRIAATIRRLHVTPELGRALSPSYPVTVPANGSGRVTMTGSKFDVDLRAEVGSGRIVARGDLDTKRWLSQAGLHLAISRLMLSELSNQAPPSRVDLDIDVAPGSVKLPEVAVTATGRMSQAQARGETWGPARLDATFNRESRHALDLQARLPGVVANARGRGEGERFGLQGDVRTETTDVNFGLQIENDDFDTTVRVQGESPATVRLAGEWPRRDQVTLKLLAATFKGQKWRSTGPAELDFGGGEVTLSPLELRSGPRRVTLAARSADGRASGRIAVRDPALTANARFDLPAAWPPPPGSPLSLHVSVPKADLQGLAAATKAQMPVEGRARLDVRLSGTGASPKLIARLHSRGLRVRPAGAREGSLPPPADARATVRYAGRAARLSMVVSTPSGDLRMSGKARVNLAPRALGRLEPKAIPIEGQLNADDLDLSWVSGLTEQLATVAGLLDANATVRGTVGKPRVDGRIEWQDGKVALTAPPKAPPEGKAAEDQGKAAPSEKPEEGK